MCCGGPQDEGAPVSVERPGQVSGKTMMGKKQHKFKSAEELKQHWKTLFDETDADKNGVIDFAEAKDFAIKMHQRGGPQLDDSTLTYFFQTIDKNNIGFIEFDEFWEFGRERAIAQELITAPEPAVAVEEEESSEEEPESTLHVVSE